MLIFLVNICILGKYKSNYVECHFILNISHKLFSKDYLSSCKRLSFTFPKTIFYDTKDNLLQKKSTLLQKNISQCTLFTK